MSNPWLKKHPFMSMWLSSANRVAGSMRARVAGEVKRQSAQATREASNDWIKLWTGAATATLSSPSPAKRKKSRK
jgi:hypothetical protein